MIKNKNLNQENTKKNSNQINTQIIKEKNSIEYRLSHYSFNKKNRYSQNIVKNIFYKYITIPPISDETKKIIKNIDSLENHDLQILLNSTLNFHFKNFIQQSRLSKAKIETYHNQLISSIYSEYQNFKVHKEEFFTKETSIIRNRLSEIDDILINKLEQIRNIKTEITNQTKIVTKNKIILIEGSKNKNKETQKFLENRQEEAEKKVRGVELINIEINAINNDVNKLNNERNELVTKLNAISLNLSNSIDNEYSIKEKRIASLNIEKIEVYIWIRDSLVSLNRTIRDVKVELGLRQIEYKWKKALNDLDKIKKHAGKIIDDFSIFESIADIEDKIELTNTINIKDRIVNLKTSEEILGEQ